MKDYFIYTRNSIIHFLYKTLFRRVFFSIDAETVHDKILGLGQFIGRYAFTRRLAALLFSYSNKKLEQTLLNIKFKNPIGLAAGFDKNAQLTDILPCVGFGFAEIGSITGRTCEGNAKPRLWRLKKSRGLIVNYGLKNEGCEKISFRLRNKSFSIPIGISIAKTNDKETVGLEAGINDYTKAFKKFVDIGAYFAINISCPNTFDDQPFTNANKLSELLNQIDKISTQKPIFLKISPDLSEQEIDDIIAVSENHRVAGFICSNCTKNRSNNKIIEDNFPKGGISGKPVEDLSNSLISYIYNKTKGKFIIIGCGGVFSAEDAYKKIKLGASLVQLISGMIFEGPQRISEINQGLVSLLKKDEFSNISQAIGSEHSSI